jgi:hypothetical protein
LRFHFRSLKTALLERRIEAGVIAPHEIRAVLAASMAITIYLSARVRRISVSHREILRPEKALAGEIQARRMQSPDIPVAISHFLGNHDAGVIYPPAVVCAACAHQWCQQNDSQQEQDAFHARISRSTL